MDEGRPRAHRWLALTLLTGCAAAPAVSDAGRHDAEDLAMQLANPVASLVSVPFQFNYDQDIGPDDGDRITLNIQPVIPFSLDEDWNLISRTIIPLIDQDDVPSGEHDQGLGDTVQSLFFSPKQPTEGGWIWGAGPAVLAPTASNERLGADQWGLGPTGVVLKQSGPWTYGALGNHIWRVAGDDDPADINASFLQPFLVYTTPTAWSFALNSEATYDWTTDELALPVNLAANKIVDVGGQLMQFGAGVRYWLEDTDTSPEGWGFRLNVVFLYPRGG